MTTLLHLNPLSRGGDVDCRQLVEGLRDLGPVEVHRADQDEPLAERAGALGERLSRIVVGGGDGTLNRALPVVLEHRVPLGVLPLGTGNDFARALGIPLDPESALQVLRAGHRRLVDVATANGIPFLNAAGIGLGPALTKRLDRERKLRLGVLAYLTSLIEVLGNRRHHRAEIVLDGKSHRVRFMQITIANGPHYGGGMTVSGDASLDDGVLHVLCLKPQSPLELFVRFATMRWGASDDGRADKLFVHPAKEVVVRPAGRTEVTLDGELCAEAPLACRCMPACLEVFAPAAS